MTTRPSPPGALVCGLTWLGDCVMAMPALQAFRRESAAPLIMLTKPGMAPLWRMQACVDEVVDLPPGLFGMWRLAATLRSRGCPAAYILPNSFRSAIVPFLARIPVRVGTPGHGRAFLLTRPKPFASAPGCEHQACEYYDLFGLEAPADGPEAPALAVPDAPAARAAAWLGAAPAPRVGLVPGAAFGPAKQWPPERFVEVGRMIVERDAAAIVVMGTPGERELCAEVARGVGPAALSLAGETNLQEFAALLSACDAVIVNDSGGMHLAAALGTPVVAIFGITDPRKTGPLGRATRVLQDSDVRHRDLDPGSESARRALARIEPESVHQALRRLLTTER